MNVAMAISIAACCFAAAALGQMWRWGHALRAQVGRQTAEIATVAGQLEQTHGAIDAARRQMTGELERLASEIASSVETRLEEESASCASSADAARAALNATAEELQAAIGSLRDNTERIMADLLKRYADSVRLDAMAAAADVVRVQGEATDGVKTSAS